MKQLILRCATMFLVAGVSLGRAGVVTDGSLGAARPLAGPNFIVPASLGKIAGGNLFHSFSQFGLNHGESAIFSGPGSVHNILARVTGGEVSSIDGAIRSTIVGANFFLLNPAGVILGADASINVSGSFAVTTGQDVKLSDGSRFNATPGLADALLTSAPPMAFGFLSANSGAISIQDSQLTSAPGKTLALAGGQVQMNNASLKTGSLVIRGGRLTMAHSNVAIAAINPSARADVQMQTSIGLTNRSSIKTTAMLTFAGLTIVNISAPTITLTDFSFIASLSNGAMNAGNLSVTTDHLMLTLGGRLDANTDGTGNGGDINVNAHDILIRDGPTDVDSGSAISASTAGSGAGGNIHLDVSNLVIGAGGLVQASTGGTGAGGSVQVDAATVSITGGSLLQTGISADTLFDSQGNAGNVQLNITGQLTLANGAQVSSDTAGSGTGGDITVTAQNILVDSRGQDSFSGISTIAEDPIVGGAAGNIVLHISDALQLIRGGEVTAFTNGPGAGGSIDVNAARLFISAKDAGGALSGITAASQNQATGRGGDVRLNLRDSLEIVAGGEISVSTSGSGAGGSVTIVAPMVSISGMAPTGIPSGITAETTGGINGGAGGNIIIETNSLIGSDGGAISASTSGSGAGGSIDITAHLLTLNNFTIRADTSSRDTVEQPVLVSQLNVLFDIDDTNDQNLLFTLVSPNGTFLDLFGGVGADGQNFHNTVLADDASVSIDQGQAPFTGRFRPSLNPLAALDGQVFNGTWFLILNLMDAGEATLNSWALRVGSTTVSSSNVPLVLPNFSTIDVALPPASLIQIKPGRGGDVRVHADTISLLNGARISAESKFPGAGGRGGDILISGKDLSITGAQGIETGISARSLGGGSSGSVQLNIGTLSLDSFGFIGSSNTVSGEAGNVFIRAGDKILLRHGSVITTSAAHANAGIIDIQSRGTMELRDSSITASAGTNGGSINIRASDTVYLADSSITATAGRQQTNGSSGGAGGNILIDPVFIVLDNSLISANAAIGRGGNITLDSSFFLDSESLITATGTQAGTINIAAPELDLSAALVTLPGSLLSAETQLRERCTAQLRGDFSSFISLGRGGTEAAPDELKVEF